MFLGVSCVRIAIFMTPNMRRFATAARWR